MSWTKEQKKYGKKRLAWHRVHETAATYRRSFLLATGGFAVGVVLMWAGFTTLKGAADWIGGVGLLCLGAVSTLLFAGLVYVRYLDWRRRVATDFEGWVWKA